MAVKKSNSNPMRALRASNARLKRAIGIGAISRISRNALARVSPVTLKRKSLRSAILSQVALRIKRSEVERPRNRRALLPTQFQLHRSLVCARRSVRREVLFAKKAAGNGKAIHTPKSFNLDSKVRC